MTEPGDIPDADPTWRELRTRGREYVEGQLATARFEAQWLPDGEEKREAARRARRLVEVLEGMEKQKAPQA